MKKNIKNKIIITISILIGMFIILLGSFNKVNAMGTWKGNMPELNFNSTTGLFPQIFNNKRTIVADTSRFLFGTTNWNANINTGTVYCADQGKLLRYGKFDYNTYFNTREMGAPTTYELEKLKYINGAKTIVTNDYGGLDNFRITNAYAEEQLPEKFDSNAYAFIRIDQTDPTEANIDRAKSILIKIFEKLTSPEKPQDLSEDIDSPKIYGEWNGDPRLGPKVAVMENSKQAEDGYQKKSEGIFSSKGDDKSKQAAYILTALEDVYGNTENHTKYTEEDIQTAYWMLVDPDGIGGLKKLTDNGKELYKKSQEYAEFTSEISGGYNTSINSSNAQVIANRKEKTYTVGPYTINYPEYTDISYIKSIYISNGSNTLIIDEQHQDFEIIMNSGTAVPGSNGLTKSYPKNGDTFFIKFSASKLGYPKQVDLGVNFEYIDNCYINYEELGSEGHIYQYRGYCDPEGEFAMSKGQVTFEVDIYYTTREWESHKDGCASNRGEKCNCGRGQYDQPHTATITPYYTCDVYQPYVEMYDKYEADIAQPLTAALDGQRNYKIIGKGSNIPVHIDLTMELGGTVWEDNTGGKESIGNGQYGNEDIAMPNIIVSLYQEDGTHIGTTKTDSNGKYRFTNLNAMFQYYVKFTYNGQYYQPTYYTSPGNENTWGDGNWVTNSNGTDRRNERLSYNIKFKSIGSSPANYETSATGNYIVRGNDGKRYNETYTKQQLLGYTLQSDGNYKKTREAVIDEFGNLILNNSNDLTTQKMIQFVLDCQIDSYTCNENAIIDLYPVYEVFVIDNKPVSRDYMRLIGGTVKQLYDTAYYINQGYVQREKSDLAVKKDIDNVTLEINGQKHKYTYDTLENASNKDDTWDINIRISDAYYNANYSRELYKSDYLYKVSSYGDYATYGKSKSDELEVYVTYKIMVRNQSQSIRCKVDEIVDYYDQDYEYIDERSYAEIKVGDNKGIYNTKATTTSRYESQSTQTRTKIDGYDNIYVQGLDNVYLTTGQTAYVYLTFKVKKDTIDGEDWVKLDETIETGNIIGVGKENIVEINGYSTLYKDKTIIPNVGEIDGKVQADGTYKSEAIAGIIDKDSNPGNLNPSDVPKDGAIKYENFEDDTDKAPNLRLKLYRDDSANRVIAGTVWEDERDETIQATTTGDGIRKDNETLINGVTVQLVELMDNGTEYIWREFGDNSNKGGATNTIGKGTGSGTQKEETPIINKFNLVQNYNFDEKHDGDYAFKSFIPGKYVIRFIYGDTERTVLTKDVSTSVNSTLGKAGLNDKSYNGQDYKSTTYQEGINQNKTYIWRERSTWANGQETLGKIIRQILTYDKNVCTQNEILTYLYDITESDKLNNVSDAKDIESIRNKVIDYSDNDVVNHIAEVLASHRELPTYPNGSYNKTQLQALIDELIDKTKMTSETGTMVIELEYDRTGTGNQVVDNKASYTINNVDLGLEERAKAQLAINKDVTNVKVTLANGTILFDAKSSATNVLWKDHKSYEVGYKGNFMDPDKFGNIVNIRNKNKNKFGLIQLSMDEELMHGATIEITYDVTVSNVGEVDYKDNRFYYTGNVSNTNTIVTTKANQVIDYVANNLQFNVSNNNNWKVITKENLLAQGLVNTGLTKQIEQYNTIIVTESLSSSLVPNLYKEKVQKNAIDSVTVPLVLTQLITSENETDDLTYRNIVEIVKTSNTVGRKNEYSVVGNQDPTKEPQEIDSDKAEIVRILPPFGDAGLYITIAIIVISSIALLTVGIIFIKKKVLK